LVYKDDIKEEIPYATKDNNKLRTLLVDHDLSTSGTPEELIDRLENSSIDYEALPSSQITEILRRRRVTNYGQGSKAVKMERLRTNDRIDRDTGKSY